MHSKSKRYSIDHIAPIGDSSDSLRIMIFLVAVALLCLREISFIYRYLRPMAYSLSRIEYIYSVISSGANMPYSSIVFLLLLGDIKRNTDAISCGKRKLLTRWNGIIYCFLASVIMPFLITLFTFILTLPIAGSGFTWTESVLASQGLIETSVIPGVIFRSLTPISAVALAAWIVQLFWFVSALFLFLFSLLGMKYLGTMLYLIGIFWQSIWFGYDYGKWASIKYYTLTSMLQYAESGHEQQFITQGLQCLIIEMLICIALCVIVSSIKHHKAKTSEIIKKGI